MTALKAHEVERFFPVGRLEELVGPTPERGEDHLPDAGVVVDDEDPERTGTLLL